MYILSAIYRLIPTHEGTTVFWNIVSYDKFSRIYWLIISLLKCEKFQNTVLFWQSDYLRYKKKKIATESQSYISGYLCWRASRKRFLVYSRFRFRFDSPNSICCEGFVASILLDHFQLLGQGAWRMLEEKCQKIFYCLQIVILLV